MACWSKGMAGGYAGYRSIGLPADKHLCELKGQELRQRETGNFEQSREAF
jgi:hypothetical protein